MRGHLFGCNPLDAGTLVVEPRWHDTSLVFGIFSLNFTIEKVLSRRLKCHVDTIVFGMFAL